MYLYLDIFFKVSHYNSKNNVDIQNEKLFKSNGFYVIYESIIYYI